MPHISHTQLQMAMKCGQQWEFRYVQGLKMPPKIVMIEGRVPHFTAEQDLGHKIDTGELLADDVIQDMARDQLNQEWDKDGVMLQEDEKTVGEDKLRGQAVDAVVHMAETHHKVIAPSINPISVERKFELDIANTGYTLQGFIDVEDKTDHRLCVRDLKCPGKSPAKNTALRSQQLSLYALAVWVASHQIPSVALDFMIRLKKDLKIDHQVADRSERDLKAIVHRIASVLNAIKMGTLTPAPEGSWYCDPWYCGYWDRCPNV